jgi:hypothetical protein
MESTRLPIEFGVVARTFPKNNVGIIQPNKEEVIFFQGKDRRRLKVDHRLNQIVFGDPHRYPNILKEGTLVAFTRNRHYSAVPGMQQAGKWTDYPTWAFLHAYQLFTLKHLTKTGAQPVVRHGDRLHPAREGRRDRRQIKGR